MSDYKYFHIDYHNMWTCNFNTDLYRKNEVTVKHLYLLVDNEDLDFSMHDLTLDTNKNYVRI